MHLLTSWRDALLLVQPKTLQQLLLVTVNAIIRTVPLWVAYFWWLILATAVALYYVAQGIQWLEVMLPIMIITLILTIRPSVRSKTIRYFVSYIVPSTLLLIAWMFFPSWSFLQGFLRYFSVWPFLYAFFVFDSRGSLPDMVRSTFYTTTMYFYNAPIFLIIELIFTGFNHSIVWAESAWPTLLGYVMIFCMLRVPVLIALLCLVNTIYVKKLHEQYALYFPKKG